MIRVNNNNTVKRNFSDFFLCASQWRSSATSYSFVLSTSFLSGWGNLSSVPWPHATFLDYYKTFTKIEKRESDANAVLWCPCFFFLYFRPFISFPLRRSGLIIPVVGRTLCSSEIEVLRYHFSYIFVLSSSWRLLIKHHTILDMNECLVKLKKDFKA